jgi:glycosyltransferase involved in cell wall biosynthesis
MEPQKRQELLIEAAQHLRTSVKIVLAGNSRDPKHYQSLIKKHGVTDRVCLRGFVAEPEMIDLYANSLGVCYLPYDEDYGYVTLEGMLSGKPIVVPRDGGGATEFIEHEREGLVVEPAPQAIAEALDSLYANRAQSRAMGERGREKIKSMNLSWEHVVKSLLGAAG